MPKKETAQEQLHRGHRERLKGRCLEEGLDAFDDHQVLELLLFYALPYRDTNEIAHRLLQYFGSFSGVLDADYHELCRIPGVGPNTAVLLCTLPEFFRRYQQDHMGPKVSLQRVKDAGEYAVGLFIGCKYERFYLLCLDLQGKLIKAALLGEGTLDQVSVYPRIAAETALRYRAEAVVLTHNHPTGSLQPSADDLQVTKRIALALSAIDIDVLDHIIVGGERYVSLADMGLMKGKLV